MSATITPEILALAAISLKRRQGSDYAPYDRLMQDFAQLAERMLERPEYFVDLERMSPRERCCARALAGFDNGEDVSAFWSTLRVELRTWLDAHPLDR